MLDNLPTELLCAIIEWLPPGAVARLAKTGRSLAEVVRGLRRFLLRRFVTGKVSLSVDASEYRMRCFGVLPNRWKHGEERTYLTVGGRRQLTRRASWWYGRLHGREESYGPEGELRRIRTWYEGERHGALVYFHKDGSIRSTVNLCHGVYHGRYVTWYAGGKGKVASEAFYNMGAPTGVHTYYHEDGGVWKVCVWEGGAIRQAVDYRRGVDLRWGYRERSVAQIQRLLEEGDRTHGQWRTQQGIEARPALRVSP